MRKHTIIGMAGHIDHGKTALIKALTGIQTDQHKEEQERGITIDIGFAYWKENITIIDVPGHEKFVKNMVAGVNTVDLFLLVIAADDGIMPQTIEHLEILKFFGVNDGIVALNKSDLADPEWLMLVEDETRQFMSKHGFGDIPIVPVSAVKNSGIDTLRNVLLQKIEQLENTYIDRPFRLNVDRNFSAKGFGSIVTGTILSSQIQTGDTITILPDQKQVKIRGLQVHQKATDTAYCGQRCAINLAGVSKEELPRGTVLVKENALDPTYSVLAEIKTTDKIKVRVKRYHQVRIHIGTQEIIGKLYWFDQPSHLEDNMTYHVQIMSVDPIIAAPGDPVLIRTISPVDTIAGGKIIMINAPRIKQVKPIWPEIFSIWASEDLTQKIKSFFEFAGYNTITIQMMAKNLFENDAVCADVVSTLIKQKLLIDFEYKNEPRLISTTKMNEALDLIVRTLDENADRTGNSAGYNIQQIKNLLKKFHISGSFLERTLQKAVASGRLILTGSDYLTADQAKNDNRSELKNQIKEIYKKQGFEAPDLEALSKMSSIDPKSVKNLTLALAKEGRLVSIGGQFYLHADTFQSLIDFLKAYFQSNVALDVARLREFTNVSRKFLIPILEYLDNNHWTRREGDARIAGPALAEQS